MKPRWRTLIIDFLFGMAIMTMLTQVIGSAFWNRLGVFFLAWCWNFACFIDGPTRR